MIEARDLCRSYGDFTAVDGVSFSVDEGEILGILGPNGAGKTTTIRMITGFLPPSRGSVRVGGKDLFADSGAARREIGYLPENVNLYPEMRVEEYLAYRGRLQGMARAATAGAIGEVLASCLLEEVSRQIIGTLSKGFRQRVGLAAAILHHPCVLVLDEPTVGLDPKQIIAIRALIRELGKRRTLLLSTHILPEVELLCDRVLIIDRGVLVDQGTPRDLRERWVGNTVLRVTLKGDPGGAREALEGLGGAASARPGPQGGGTYLVECRPGEDPREAVFHLAVERGWVLIGLAEQKASLEDIFVRLTTHDAAGGHDEAGAAASNSLEVTGDAESAEDAQDRGEALETELAESPEGVDGGEGSR